MTEVKDPGITPVPLEAGNISALKEWRLRVLKSDCPECYGLCCVALHFSASEGFPLDKAPGKPCPYLMANFKCEVHHSLAVRGYKGCIGFDCLGAGQRVSRVTFPLQSWRTAPKLARPMFDAFVVMRHLYELLWYLSEGLEQCDGKRLRRALHEELQEVDRLTCLDAEALKKIDMNALRGKSNALLIEVGEQVRGVYGNGKAAPQAVRQRLGRYADLAGAKLSDMNLKGANLRGAILIASDLRHSDLSGAELIGADLRDSNLSGANLSGALYLTQAQVNSAKGDRETRLPEILDRPVHWV
ncbi:pentapeptide repeat-containing protein [Acidaminobacter sp.]|uniref:pentapeptide repeat-containing protein n=1 Tax=Acidaminobacter sp. TaxID=1872102 RepID=UPI0025660FD6|nr:pentapeptide repeat-containing protein [Acidaminobacter sp.]MDK9711795.1 pentapeptide repeat-containing protein [Acidaminobacter sp.]